jgi:hypothetical protein
VCLYSTRQSPEEPRDLIIAFCGLANRLQLPTAVFCQHLDGSQFDILLVRDPSKRIYIEGIPGYAPSLALVADRFRRELDLDAYGSVYCLGTSGGGWAALMTGDMLKARRAISIAGKPPALTPKLQHVWTSTGGPTADVDFGVFERYFAETAARFTPMIALFGADNPADREGSIAIQRITGAKAIGLMGIADHNLMFELLNRRCLARVLRHYLLENLGDNTQLTGETPPPIETRATEAAKQDL